MSTFEIVKSAIKYVNKILIPLDDHYYHQYEHALEVMDRAIYIGKKEGLNDEELELVALASLFHDTGFIIQYDNNEIFGAKIARNYLNSILYPPKKIKKIEELIMATKPDYKSPKDMLERVIKDADLDNLGRDDFFVKGTKLRKELEKIKNIKIKEPEWNHGTLDFLKENKYYTKTQLEERNAQKERNKKELQKMIHSLEKKIEDM